MYIDNIRYNYYMNKKPLTLLITIHSQFESVVFFHTLIERSKFDKEKVMFAFDCKKEEIPNDVLDIIERENYSYYCPDENIGKLWLVIKATKLIDTPYFKIIDQDDSIYFDNLKGVEEELNSLDSNYLIRHKACKIKSNSELYSQTIDEEIIKKQIKVGKNSQFIQGVNYNTIYPTKIAVLMNNINISRQEFHNDVLISNFIKGIGCETKEVKGKFYIHFHKFGQTSKVTIERTECILELYKNYLAIRESYSNFDYKKLMNGSKFFHKVYIWWFTTRYIKGNKLVKSYKKETYKILEEL